MTSKVEARLVELGVELPATPIPVAAYLPARAVADWVYVSGQIPLVEERLIYTGKVGLDLSLEQGYAAAKICAIRCIAALRSVVEDLDKVQIVKVTGYVNSANDFTAQAQVVNGASEFLEKVFGEKGRHARAAVGVAQLPGGAAVEVELVAYIMGDL